MNYPCRPLAASTCWCIVCMLDRDVLPSVASPLPASLPEGGSSAPPIAAVFLVRSSPAWSVMHCPPGLISRLIQCHRISPEIPISRPLWSKHESFFSPRHRQDPASIHEPWSLTQKKARTIPVRAFARFSFPRGTPYSSSGFSSSGISRSGSGSLSSRKRNRFP